MDHSRTLDPEVLEAVLAAAGDDPRPDLPELTARFPGREEQVQAALKAVARYWTQVHEARANEATARTSPDLLLPGATLGDFAIDGVLGVGAMGVVYRARQHTLGDREVALKVLPTTLVARDPRFAGRFRREATLASKLHHPNVAEVYGFGSDEGTLFFAMRLIEGRTLQDALSRLAARRRAGDTVSSTLVHVRRAAHLVRDLASALAAIHTLGLVHRDVKPANVLLEHAPLDDRDALTASPVLVDFGLLRPKGTSELTGSRTLLGTPAYASPEVQLGRQVDARADVFSLGAVLYDLLTVTAPGERPVATAELPPVRAINRTVDARLAAIVGMAMDERPALRYPDGAALQRDLDRYLRDESIRALPATAIGRARLWARRHPVATVKAIAAAGVLALLLALMSVWVLVTTTRISASARDATMLEEQGDLRAAAAAFRQVYDDRDLAEYLPWLGDDVARAERYWAPDGDLAPLRAALEPETEESFAVAHDRIHEFLFDPSLARHRDLALCLLLREARDGETTWRRRLALETFADLTLFDLDNQWWCDELRPLLESIVERGVRSEADTGILRAAVSALGGLRDSRAFRMLLPWIGAEDAELSRLALYGTFRTWEWLNSREGPTVPSLDQATLAAWVMARWKQVLAPSGSVYLPWRPSGSIHHESFTLVAFAAWTRLHLRDDGKLLNWPGLPESLNRALQGMELALRAFKAAPGGDFVTPSTGIAEVDHYWTSIFRRPTVQILTQGDYSYRYETTIWDGRIGLEARAESSSFVRDPLVRAEFQCAHPMLTGNGALDMVWSNALHEGELEWRFLKFIRPGASSLRLRARIPPDARAATICLSHTRAARWPIPEGGRCRVRLSVQNGATQRIGDAPMGSDTPWTVRVDHGDLVGRDILDVEVSFLSGNTTYRVNSLRVEWHCDGI